MLDGITDSMDMSLSKLQGDREGQGGLVPAVHVVTELDMAQQQNSNNRCVIEDMEGRVQSEVRENRLDLPSQGLKLVMWGPHLELQVKFSIGSKAVCFCAINGSLIRNTLTPEVAR